MEVEVKSTVKEENSNLSNYKHKLFIGFLKILPMIMAGLFLINTVLSYFNIENRIFSYLSSIGLIPWLFILIASYIFKFCEYHRMFLWYILVNNLICWADEEFKLPINNWDYFILHMIVAGIFLFLILYFHQKQTI